MPMKYLLFFLILSKAFAIDCPAGTTPVSLRLEYQKSNVEFCQKSHEGSLVKHGPEIITNDQGVVTKKQYEMGQEVEVAKEKKMTLEDQCKKFSKLIGKVVNPFPREGGGTSRRIVKNPELCRGYPFKRIAFIQNNKPYDKVYEFKKKCHLKGILRIEKDKDLKTTLKMKNAKGFNAIKLNYKITKENFGRMIYLHFKVRDAHLVSDSGEEDVHFELESSVKINVIDVLHSKGREGVESLEPKVKVHRVGPKSCS